MKMELQSISKKLSQGLKAHKPGKAETENFAANMESYLNHIDSNETEENLKTHLMSFLKPAYQPSNTIEQYGDIDFVIRTGGKGTAAAVLDPFIRGLKVHIHDIILRNEFSHVHLVVLNLGSR